MSARLLFCILACCAVAALAQPYFPDPSVTPGAVNPNVTQDNISTTVCVSGWTATIRPTTGYIARLKKKQMRELGLPGTPHEYHEDHLVPLCVGGHPSDPGNLWPQPIRGRWTDKIKDQLEGSVCRAVCRGDMTLEEGRALFLKPDWSRTYIEFFELQ